MLIEKRSNVRAVDNKQMTPLHYIALLESSNRGHRNWPEGDTLGEFNFISGFFCHSETEFYPGL